MQKAAPPAATPLPPAPDNADLWSSTRSNSGSSVLPTVTTNPIARADSTACKQARCHSSRHAGADLRVISGGRRGGVSEGRHQQANSNLVPLLPWWRPTTCDRSGSASSTENSWHCLCPGSLVSLPHCRSASPRQAIVPPAL